MKHHSIQLIGLFILIFSLISPVIAQQEYEEGDDVEIEEITLTGFDNSNQQNADSSKKIFTQSFCDNPQRCQNIDEVWYKRISIYINPLFAQQIWDPKTNSWKTFQEVYAPPPPPPSSTPSSTTLSAFDNHIKFPGSGKCFEKALFSSAQERETKVISIPFQGKTISVNPIVAPLFKKIDSQITAANTGYAFTQISTGSWRCVRSPKVKIVDQTTCQTSTGKIARSKHSYGIAIDINPTDNPFCTPSCSYTLPQKVIDIFKANDFSWGGDWPGAKDYMHFDWKGNQGDFNGDGTVEFCGFYTDSLPPTPTSPTTTPAGKAWEQYSASEAWTDALTEVPGITGDTQIWKSQFNGKEDKLLRINTGRDNILFIPSTTTASKPIDIIYFFHGLGGFGLDMSERILPQAKALSDAGYNFVIVFPELPWSRGTYTESKSVYDNPRKKDGRESFAWDGTDSDFTQFHQEVIQKITTKYGLMLFSQGKIFIIGHSNGGSAIGKAAEKNAFNTVKPDVITFSDAEYKWQGQYAIKRLEDSYTSSPIKINLLVQANNQLKKEPTVYTIDYLKSKNCIVDHTTEKTCGNVHYLPLTVDQTKNQGIGILQKSKHRTGDDSNGLHALIGKMSIYWTVKNYYTPAKTT